MANKNYYDILGVSKDASDKDIKSKYRDLSKKYHPDRQNGKSDKEKQEAENKFKEINEAYSVLSDAEKRKNYDTFGSPDGNPMGGFGDMFSGFGDMFNFDFSDLFGGGRSHKKSSQRSEQVHPGESYNINVGLSIEDIYNGIQNKQFEIEVNRRCSSCNGTGGSGAEKCPHCNGTGMKREVKQTAFGRMENMTYCWECNGTGQRVKNKCTKCNGSGFEKYIEKLTLNVPKFARNGQQIMFNGAGSDSKSPKGVRGDVMVTLVHQFDTNRYRIINNDVYEDVREQPIKTSKQSKPNTTKSRMPKITRNFSFSDMYTYRNVKPIINKRAIVNTPKAHKLHLLNCLSHEFCDCDLSKQILIIQQMGAKHKNKYKL